MAPPPHKTKKAAVASSAVASPQSPPPPRPKYPCFAYVIEDKCTAAGCEWSNEKCDDPKGAPPPSSPPPSPPTPTPIAPPLPPSHSEHYRERQYYHHRPAPPPPAYPELFYPHPSPEPSPSPEPYPIIPLPPYGEPEALKTNGTDECDLAKWICDFGFGGFRMFSPAQGWSLRAGRRQLLDRRQYV